MLIKKHFNFLRHQRVLVCKQCQYAVWLDEIAGHLGGKAHDVKRSEINGIREELLSYQDTATRESFKFPPRTDSAISELRPPKEGIACRYNEECSYVCSTDEAMRKHHASYHQWTGNAKGGRPTKAEQQTAKMEREKRMQRGIAYQQFFKSRKHSGYFQVAAQPAIKAVSDFDKLREIATQERNEVGETIQEGNKFEINPWIKRTGWARYLKDKNRAALLKLVEAPTAEEAVTKKVWDTVGEVAKMSQRTVADCSNAVKYAAIRIQNKDKNEDPLEAYFNNDGIAGRARTWQQIVACLIRNRSRKTIDYQATEDQERRLDELLREAVREDGDESEDGDKDKDEDGMTKLQTACLDFCLELLNQVTRNHEFESPLLAALAVLGVSKSGWRDASEYAPVLSETLKCARFMIVRKAFETAKGWDGTRPGARVIDLDGREPECEADLEPTAREERGVISEVTRIVNAFSKHGTSSPLENMVVLRARGLGIHFGRTGEGSVNWKDHNTLLYGMVEFTMGQFRSTVHGLVAEALGLLTDSLLLCKDLPAVPWQSMCDNPVNRTPGWSFLKDKRTRWPVDGRTWMLNRVEGDLGLRKKFYTKGEMDRTKVRRYARTCDDLLAMLLVLLHLTGGQPARGTELRSIRHSNTVAGEERNIFIDEGMLAYVTRYHKGWAMRGTSKVIHRYAPREVADLLIWYLWLVKPFGDALQRFLGIELPEGAFLWTTGDGNPWPDARMARALSTAFEAGMGCEMGVLQYRHIAIAIGRRHTQRKFEDDDEDDAADLQAGHTSKIGNMLYGRPVTEMQGAVTSTRQAYRDVSLGWHEFLRFGKPRRSFADESSRKRRRRRLRDADVHKAARAMLGDGARLRGGQEEALGPIMHGESPVVAVMATGGGKSMLFMLPAWAEQDGLTVVVLPLVALREDMQRRCDELGIRCAAWDWRRPPEDATIVLVTPESAVTASFGAFLSRAQVTKRLDRIVIDECHVVLDAGFRPALQRLDELTGVGVPMLLLTATLPPTVEGRLREAMGWESDPRLIRRPTVRRNLRYSVVECTGRAKEDVVRALVESEAGKVVVYMNSRDAVERMAADLDARFFHARLAPEAKSQLLADLRSGEVRVVVATGALGVGVDVEDIRLVVHADVPRSLIDYAQESGRAGRDGEASRAAIVGSGRCDEDVRKYMRATCRRKVLDAYLDGDDRERCRTGEEACDRCDDRPPKRGLDDDRDEVDELQTRKRQRLARQRTAKASGWAREAKGARAAINKWRGKCLVCHGRGLDYDHWEYGCGDVDASALTQIRTWRRALKMADFGACYGCLLPQSQCGSWAEKEGGCFVRTGEPCEDRFVVSDVVFSVAARHHPLHSKWIRRLEEQGAQWGDEAAWLAWLSARRDRGSVEGSNMFWEFCWITSMLDRYGGQPTRLKSKAGGGFGRSPTADDDAPARAPT
jgi:superfamily II DNA or RNA helicase